MPLFMITSDVIELLWCFSLSVFKGIILTPNMYRFSMFNYQPPELALIEKATTKEIIPVWRKHETRRPCRKTHLIIHSVHQTLSLPSFPFLYF